MSIKSNLPFVPITAIEEKIKHHDITNGNLYFATDTGRIYLDTVNERLSFGGHGVSILYASGEGSNIEQERVNFTYYMNATYLDDKDAEPKEDDLIINKDGRFFKILDYDAVTKNIHMSLIAVSGTGGGGGGTGGGSEASITLTCTGAAPNAQIYIYGQKQEVEFTVKAQKDAIVTLTYVITSVATQETRTFPFTVPANKAHIFDLGSNLFKGVNTLQVLASGSNSGSATPLNYTNINAITLALKASNNFNPLKYAYDSSLLFYSIPVGTVDKELKVYLNNDLVASDKYNSTITEETKDLTIPQ